MGAHNLDQLVPLKISWLGKFQTAAELSLDFGQSLFSPGESWLIPPHHSRPDPLFPLHISSPEKKQTCSATCWILGIL